tara:strand:- start:405 stop:1418 length:1014 start_codon:yes stop_codon:yes gene_type:complete
MSADLIEYLTDSLDVSRESGDELVLRECLFCGRVHKMYVNIAKLRFHCFAASCGASGRLVALVMAIEDCDAVEASRIIRSLSKGLLQSKPVSALERAFNDLVNEPKVTEEDARLEAMRVPLPQEYEPCWDGDQWRVPQYLVDRGLDNDSIKKWQVGFARRGRYAGRVIIPVKCSGMTSFVARDSTGDAIQKYLNPGAAMMGQMLFGYDACSPSSLIVAVEGVFDAIRLWSLGIPAVAYFGSHPRVGQTRLLEQLEPSRLILMPDPDAVGQVTEYAASVCGKFDELYVAQLQSCDPASAPREEVLDALKRAALITGKLDALEKNFGALNAGRDGVSES